MPEADASPSPRRVEAALGEGDPGRFRCTECGDCCRLHRVPVTAADLSRLHEATALPPSALVDWLSPDEVDMTGEPESFVVLRGGRRLPVLSHVSGTCRFLTPDHRCGIYEARPFSCRTFPLELSDWASADGARHLTVLSDARCPGTFDGPDDEERARARLEVRTRELEAHTRLVAEWNRRQRRHRWARGRVERAETFLAFLLRHLPPEETR